ncbi:MAG: Rv3235 family protein [Nocardioidaceae bacterium]
MNDRIASVRSLGHPRHRVWRPVDTAASLDRRDLYVQGSLALTYPLAGGLSSEPCSRALTVVQSSASSVVGTDIPSPETWAARFLQAVVEVVSSDRPLSQLVRWTDSRVFDDVARRRQLVSAHSRRATVRAGRHQVATVHISRPQPDVAEIAARVKCGPRSRAIAAKLEYDRDRWQCTAIVFG